MKMADVGSTATSPVTAVCASYSVSEVVVAYNNNTTTNSKNNNIICQSLLLYNTNNVSKKKKCSGKMIQVLMLMVSTMIVYTIGDLWKSTWMISQPIVLPESLKISDDTGSHLSLSSPPPQPPPPQQQQLVDSEDVQLSIEQYVLKHGTFRSSSPKQLRAIQKNLQFAYANVQEMLHRPFRFPPIQQRVQLYMSNWYIPPCQQQQQQQQQQPISNNDDDKTTSAYVTYQYDSSPMKLLTVREIATSPAVAPDNNGNNNSAVRPTNVQQQQQQQRRTFVINSHFDGTHDESFDEIHYMDQQLFVQNCTHKYCQDMVEFFLPALHRVLLSSTTSNNTSTITGTSGSTILQQSDNEYYKNIPILYQFGDMHQTRGTQQIQRKVLTTIQHVRYPNVPVLQKVRVATTTATTTSKSSLSSSWGTIQPDDTTTNVKCYQAGERRGSIVSENKSIQPQATNTNNVNNQYASRIHYEPIIFKLKTHRHYGGIYKVADADTVPWEQKKNVAIFRGGLTGMYPSHLKLKDVGLLSVIERCQLLPRCWFTYTHRASNSIDAKLTEPYEQNKLIPRVISTNSTIGDGTATKLQSNESIELYGKKMSMSELLQYKVLILLEGNDISSGLKWALFSNSIVMMPPPSLTSWAMEELLQPWVHYVPIQIFTTNTTNNDNGKSSNDSTASTVITTVTTTDAEEKMQWIINNDKKAREIVKASTLWIADLVLHPDVSDDEIHIFDDIVRRYLSHFVPQQS